MSIENKENLKKIYNRSLEDFLDELMDMELITTEECSDYFYHHHHPYEKVNTNTIKKINKIIKEINS